MRHKRKPWFFSQSSNPFIKVFVFFPKEEKPYTHPHMHTENDCNLAIKSIFSSLDFSKLSLFAVKNKVILASLVCLTAGTWLCWGLWGWGLKQGGSVGSVCLAVLPAASLQVWSIPCKGTRVCVEMALQGAPLAWHVAAWRGRCWDFLLCA